MIGRPPRFRSVVLLLGAASCLLADPAVRAGDAIGTTALDAIFSDHMVLQRDAPLELRGSAPPNATVTARLAGQSVTARADTRGRWSAHLAAMPAGGPHELSLEDATGVRQTVRDLLIGDVWLCSGQSNMELQVERALDSRAEMQDASDSGLRLLQVAKSAALNPRKDLPATDRWTTVSSDSIRRFSALCYFTGRELRRKSTVPIGLIHASWGGSNITAWMSEESLLALDSRRSGAELVALRRQSPEAALQRWGATWQDWWRKAGRAGEAAPWEESASGADTSWLPVPGLTTWESWSNAGLADFNGMVWYRSHVELSARQASALNQVRLGRADEMDQVWVNGQIVGSGWDAGEARRYDLPRGLLRAGRNTILVNVHDTYASGGLVGDPGDFFLARGDSTDERALLGNWEYRVDTRQADGAPRVPWGTLAGYGTLTNAMIAPLAGLRLRGVLWYQGESNTGDAAGYGELLGAWMKDWRAEFDDPALPFVIVQLAGYGAAPTAPAESSWAELREAQRLAVQRDSRSALVVTIDLGERTDIHPANKQEVARRAARAIRSLFGESAASRSGPVPSSAHHSGQDVIVEFDAVDGRLVTYSSAQPIGFELCGREPGSCRYVLATLEGDRSVRLHGDMGQAAATRVRYCWSESPVCTLYDSERLPTGPFELAIP
jgi:sialate O-acetylesterase